MDMTELLGTVSGVVAQIVSWVGNLITMVTDNPLLLILAVLGIVGIVLRMARSFVPGI